MLDGRYIEGQPEPPFCVNPLSVAKPEGKKLRLVLDQRNINKHLLKQAFRYEDLRSLSQLFDEEFWFFTWDLKSGYHHVDIYAPHRKFLGFLWNLNGKLRYFIFCVLPFALSSACYCFTKLLRPLVKRWRQMSHAAFVYLDGGISGHKNRVDASAASIIQKKDLECSGFKLNEELNNKLNNFHFEIPPRKIQKLKENIEYVLASDNVSFRKLAKIAGFINSLYLAVGPPVRLFSRQLFFTISQRDSWSGNLDCLAPRLIEELRFWLTNLSYLNGYNIRPKVTSVPVTITADASGVGHGGYFPSQPDMSIQYMVIGLYRKVIKVPLIKSCWPLTEF